MSKVSVIIPSYNHSEYVCQSIESVFGQDVSREILEVIVIDDCSSDDTLEKLRDLNGSYEFTLLVNAHNVGLNASIERAIQECTGEYVCLLASDDFIIERKISTQLAYMQKHNLDCVYSRGFVVDTNGNIVGEQNLEEFNNALDNGEAYALIAVDDTCGPLMQSAMFKLDVARKITQIRRKFKSDDWVVLLYLLKDFRLGFIDEALFYYRVHPENTHKKYWSTLPMRLEIPCVYLNESENHLRMKSISNILSSHAAALVRDGKYMTGLRFLLASLFFGVPVRKIFRKIYGKIKNER